MSRTLIAWARRGLPLFSLVVCMSGAAAAQEGPAETESLRQELERLRARLEAVEARGGKVSAEDEDSSLPAAPAAPDAPASPASVAPVDTSAPLLRAGTKDEGGGFVLQLSEEMRLRFDGQIRVRGEYRGDSYAQPNQRRSTDFVVQRVRLSFDYELSRALAAHVTIQDSRVWGDKLDGLSGARLNSDQPELLLYEGYASLREPFGLPIELKVGRIAVPRLGDQRLISDLDWSHIGRAFDGALLTYEPKGWHMTAFASNLREASALPTPGDESDDTWLVGAYVSNRMVAKHEFDAFLYWRRIGDRGLGALTTDHTGRRGSRKDYTAGVRLKGAAGPVFYNGLLAYQFGDVARDKIAAWAAACELGVSFSLGESQKLKISSEFAFASGDRNPNDGRNETFDPLLPFAHFFNGHQDLFAWRNLYSTNLKIAFWPLENLSLHSDLHAFWLQRRDDAWYGLGFSRTDPGGLAGGSSLGTELDLYCKFKVLEGRLSFWGGYSHFFPGEYIRDTGSKTSDQSWAFLMATVDF